jgi:hypothetical protein
MKLVHESRRAKFLKEMLDAFDGEDYNKMGNLVNDVFVNFWPIRWSLDGNAQLSEADEEAVKELSKGFKRLLGRERSSARLSVTSQSLDNDIVELWKSTLEKLSPEGKRAFMDVLEFIDLGHLESLDARYAQEVVEILRKIVIRMGKLDELPPLTTPNRSVQLAFEEAHRCYLYGFRTACAALCRATVEFSLREALEAVGHTYLVDETSFCSILQVPKAKALLGDLHGFADEIRRAGNDSVHDASNFEKQYPADKVRDLVLKTRKIVEHLYALPNP